MINTALGNVKAAIGATYRAIEQKRVPRYLAEFEYRFDDDTIAWSSVRTPPTPYKLLKLAEVNG